LICLNHEATAANGANRLIVGMGQKEGQSIVFAPLGWEIFSAERGSPFDSYRSRLSMWLYTYCATA
jgi:hypothetical protein